MSTQTLPTPRGNLKLLGLVVGLLLLPFLIAGGLFFGGWKPASTGEHGELLTPPMRLPLGDTKDQKGSPLSQLKGYWILMLIGKGPCDTNCVDRVDEMRRIHVALYKGMPRVQRLVLSDQLDDANLAQAAQKQPDLVLATLPANWPLAVDAGFQIGIVDPDGQLVLRYPQAAQGKAIRADFDRLLKYSWNG